MNNAILLVIVLDNLSQFWAYLSDYSTKFDDKNLEVLKLSEIA